MTFLIAGWVAGFLAGVFVIGLLRAASKPEPVEHDHDDETCDVCSALIIRGYLWGTNDAARRERTR